MSVCTKIIIYYFSGTGNSAKVSEWISALARQKGIGVETRNIGTGQRIQIGKPDPEALLIFISPVHGFNYPPVMMHFILRFPGGRNPTALMCTRAGMRIGKVVTPGLTGIAFLFSALVLRLKGYRVKAMAPFDLPSNWISLHPGLNKPTVIWLHKKIRVRVMSIAERILSGSRSFRNWYEIAWDLLIAPVSVLYYLIGRFFFAKSFYADRNCDNCGLCIRQCPVKAIKLKHDRPFWTYDCESCMHCMSHCPKKSIQTGHGYITAIFLLSLSLIWSLLIGYIPGFAVLTENRLLKMLLQTAVFFIILTLGYRMVHRLLPYRLFSRIIEYTSLTKYKFWGRRYKALKDSEFN